MLGTEIASAPFRDLFARHIGAAMLRQRALAGLICDGDWNVDLESGALSFAGGPSFKIQALGSESERTQTWLWAWANTQSDLPEGVLEAAQRLRRMALAPEFRSPSFPIATARGGEIAAIAGGLLGGMPFYRCPYQGGALWVLITDAPALVRGPFSPLWTVTALRECLDFGVEDHWALAQGLFRDVEAAVEAGPDRLAARFRDGSCIVLKLDAEGRIGAIEADLKPEGGAPALEEAPRRPWWRL